MGRLPALLQGFFDRALQPGFAFRYRGTQDKDWEQLLGGRSADLLVCHDQPLSRLRFLGPPAHRQMVRSVLGACGIATRRLEEFAPMRSSSEEQRQGWLRRAEQLGSQVCSLPARLRPGADTDRSDRSATFPPACLPAPWRPFACLYRLTVRVPTALHSATSIRNG